MMGFHKERWLGMELPYENHIMKAHGFSHWEVQKGCN